MAETPDWAVKRAVALMNEEHSQADLANEQNLLALSCYRSAFARYIAAHEDAPVDPLLIEARMVIADNYGTTRMADGSLALGDGPLRVEAIKTGKGDAYWEVRCVLAALRRGIEIAKVQSNA